MKNQQFQVLTLFSVLWMLVGCGMNDLPDLRSKAESPFKEMMVQYRLRADVALKMARLMENEFSEATTAVSESRSKALSVELGIETYDERQANRFQSFQNFLSRDVAQLARLVEQNKKTKSMAEFQTQKEQFDRLDKKVIMLKREYLKIATGFNKKSKKFPHSLYNKWKHKLQPLPVIGSLAQAGGQ